MMFTLRVGFDLAVPEDQGEAQAVEEWLEACTREGRAPVGAPSARVVRDDLERTALGEYVVEVTGERDGDQ